MTTHCPTPPPGLPAAVWEAVQPGDEGAKENREKGRAAPTRRESFPAKRGAGCSGGFAAEYACRLLDHVTCGAHSLVKRAALRRLRGDVPGAAPAAPPRLLPFLTPPPPAAYWPYSSSPLAAFDVETCVDRLSSAGEKREAQAEEEEGEELLRWATEAVDERAFLALGKRRKGPRRSVGRSWRSASSAADEQVPLWVVDTLPVLAEAATLFRDGGRSLATDPAAMDRAIQVNLVGLIELNDLTKSCGRFRAAVTREEQELDQLRSALARGLHARLAQLIRMLPAGEKAKPGTSAGGDTRKRRRPPSEFVDGELWTSTGDSDWESNSELTSDLSEDEVRRCHLRPRTVVTAGAAPPRKRRPPGRRSSAAAAPAGGQDEEGRWEEEKEMREPPSSRRGDADVDGPRGGGRFDAPAPAPTAVRASDWNR